MKIEKRNGNKVNIISEVINKYIQRKHIFTNNIYEKHHIFSSQLHWCQESFRNKYDNDKYSCKDKID